jgi:nicotinate dehydrogenase subunit B
MEKKSFPMDRREFIKLMGGLSGGIFVFFNLGDLDAFQEEARRRSGGQSLPTDFNAFLRIGEDGRVVCFTGKIEMGQGVITSLPMMLAEELDVPLDSVDIVMGDTDLCPWDMGTFGSLSTRNFGPALRAAGAEARAVLIQLASEKLSVSPDSLEVREGVVFDKSNPKAKISYAELAQGKRIERHLEGKPVLKDPSKFTVVGKPVLRRDAVDKVTGKGKYAGDIRLPGMFYAKVLKPPAHGAKLKSLDASAAEKVPGARVIREGDLTAVLHELPDQAEKALAQIKADWDLPGEGTDDRTIFDHLLAVAPQGQAVAQGGDIEEGKKQASAVFDETYLNSYVAHSAIETHTALASVEGDKATIWPSSQTPFSVKEEVAQALGLAPPNVHIITPFVGGGFGGKTRNKQAVEAARLSKIIGKPVQVAWSRADEFFEDTFRPAAVVKIRSGIKDSGEIVFWDYTVYFAGERGAQQFYAIPHHKTVVSGEWMRGVSGAHPFGVGAWRAPAVNTNTFARESQIDIMAAKSGIDTLDFRLNNLSNDRMKALLKAAAAKFGWTAAKAPSGRGYGIACADYLGTYVATVAEVEVDKASGHVQVKRVVCAQDMGLVVNPEGAKIQIEGCVMMGLGYALTEEVHFKNGRILDLNFDSYEIPRFSWLPRIEAVLVQAGNLPASGGGEPAIVCMGAVVANAISAATGARLFQLPMTPERVKQALQAK